MDYELENGTLLKVKEELTLKLKASEEESNQNRSQSERQKVAATDWKSDIAALQAELMTKKEENQKLMKDIDAANSALSEAENLLEEHEKEKEGLEEEISKRKGLVTLSLTLSLLGGDIEEERACDGVESGVGSDF